MAKIIKLKTYKHNRGKDLETHPDNQKFWNYTVDSWEKYDKQSKNKGECNQ